MSVIIPAYNRENYISRCIDSVLMQDDVSAELIIIDDGSTDETLDICNSYSEKYSNVIVRHQDNKGLASARNVGLDIASGEYITFLDSDDCLAENSLANMVNAIRNGDADVVIGSFDIVGEDGYIIEKSSIPPEYSFRQIDSNEFWKLNSNKQLNILFTVVWGKLYKRKIWENLRFGDGIRFAEDELILPELIEKCRGFFLIDRVVYIQTSSIGSLSRSSFDYNKLNSPESKLKTTSYLIHKGLYDCAVEKWGIAVGEIILMTRLSNEVETKKKVRQLQRESFVLGKNLYRYMDIKKKIKFLAYAIGYPFYRCISSR